MLKVRMMFWYSRFYNPYGGRTVRQINGNRHYFTYCLPVK